MDVYLIKDISKKSLFKGYGRLKIAIFEQIAVTLCILAAGLLLTGAGLPDGVALFEKGDYREARQVLNRAVAEAPDDPQAHFYLGRTCLALEEALPALPYFEKAIQLDPENAAYYFWLGVTHWALLDLDRELAAYDQALGIDPQFLPAHVYAGHNQLDRGQWADALGHYVTVLQAVPAHPEALYNAGVALKALDREEEAVAVWRRYLQHHRAGSLAVDAVRNLNAAGDFSYRAFAVGKRLVVGPSPGFQKSSLRLDAQLAETLDEIGRIIQANNMLTFQIVTFVLNNPDLAAQRAKKIKDYITVNFPEVSLQRMRISWFGQGEDIQMDGMHYELDASVNLFTVKNGGEVP